MIDDLDVPYQPGWWLKVLAEQLHNRRVGRAGRQRFTRRGVQASRIRPGLELISDYLAGEPPLRDDIHSDWSAPFRQFLRMGQMNIAPKLVSSTANRMGIADFRTAAADDELGDQIARDLIRRNKLGTKVREVHDHMLGRGDGYTIVTPPDARRSWSAITAESPMHCITAHNATTGETLAGLKMFRDDWDATDWAYLFLPGELWVARCDHPASTLFGPKPFAITRDWYWDVDRLDDVPGDKVAMVRFRNKDGVGEVEGQLNTLDRINDKLFHEYWVGKILAFRQRALEMPDETEDDAPAGALGPDGTDPADFTEEQWNELFTSAPDAMWKLPKGAKIWESGTTDINPLVSSIKAELQWLAFTATKPLHLVTPEAAQGSAMGASTQKEEHLFEILDRRDRAQDGWAETMSLAFEFQGESQRADAAGIEAVWGPLELLGAQEKAELISKAKGGPVPDEVVLTDLLGFTAADVLDRIRPLRARETLYRGLGAGLAGAGAAAGVAAGGSGSGS